MQDASLQGGPGGLSSFSRHDHCPPASLAEGQSEPEVRKADLGKLLCSLLVRFGTLFDHNSMAVSISTVSINFWVLQSLTCTLLQIFHVVSFLLQGGFVDKTAVRKARYGDARLAIENPEAGANSAGFTKNFSVKPPLPYCQAVTTSSRRVSATCGALTVRLLSRLLKPVMYRRLSASRLGVQSSRKVLNEQCSGLLLHRGFWSRASGEPVSPRLFWMFLQWRCFCSHGEATFWNECFDVC